MASAPDPACQATVDEYMGGYQTNELVSTEVLEETITDRTIRKKSAIFKSNLGNWAFYSFDVLKHKKVNGEWIYFSIEHQNVIWEGVNAGIILDYYDEFNSNSTISNSKNASVELFFGIKSTYYCDGQPFTRTYLTGGNSRLVFPITD